MKGLWNSKLYLIKQKKYKCEYLINRNILDTIYQKKKRKGNKEVCSASTESVQICAIFLTHNSPDNNKENKGHGIYNFFFGFFNRLVTCGTYMTSVKWITCQNNYNYDESMNYKFKL